jgi:ribosome-associated toxin RatA of RatAB toxin-antitoxin module
VRIERRILIERPPKDVFDLVSDPTAYDEFFVGISLWEPRSRKRRGVGARFKVLMQVGSIHAGGVLRVTKWKVPERIAWRSESGVELYGSWTVREAQAGSELSYEIDYSLPGPFGWLAERLTGRIVDRNARATLLAARRILEHERPARPARSSSSSKGTRSGRRRAMTSGE